MLKVIVEPTVTEPAEPDSSNGLCGASVPAPANTKFAGAEVVDACVESAAWTATTTQVAAEEEVRRLPLMKQFDVFVE